MFSDGMTNGYAVLPFPLTRFIEVKLEINVFFFYLQLDPCVNYTGCPEHTTCVRNRDFKPPEIECLCLHDCELDNEKEESFCGSDNANYRSICEMIHASCLANKNISVKHYGYCGKYILIILYFLYSFN